VGTVGACLALLLLGPGDERALRLGDVDVPDASAWRWIGPDPLRDARPSAAWLDRLHALAPADPLLIEQGFRPLPSGGLRLDDGLSFDLCVGWRLTGGYARFSTDLTSSSSKEDRFRAVLDGGGYFLGFDVRF
jgi:hypothetical protein